MNGTVGKTAAVLLFLAACLHAKITPPRDSIYFLMTDRFFDADASNNYTVRKNDVSAYRRGDFEGGRGALRHDRDARAARGRGACRREHPALLPGARRFPVRGRSPAGRTLSVRLEPMTGLLVLLSEQQTGVPVPLTAAGIVSAALAAAAAAVIVTRRKRTA